MNTSELGLRRDEARPRRPYRLSETGRAALREAARRNEPWRRSTGPRTAVGKARARMNSLVHGERSEAVIAAKRGIIGWLRRVATIVSTGQALQHDSQAISAMERWTELVELMSGCSREKGLHSNILESCSRASSLDR